MHHFSDLEKLSEKYVDTISREHVQVLLDFLRPEFQHLCASAQERLTQPLPTVTFKDIWFVMKPGSIAYAKWDDEYWIGCIIEDITRQSHDPLKSILASWSVNVWLLRVSETTGEIGSVSTAIDIDYFDGERPVTSLPIFPREFHDNEDGGLRRREFENRGDKIREMFWEGYRYMSYDGECPDDKRRYVSVKPPN